MEEILPFALTVELSDQEIAKVLKYKNKTIHQQSML